MTTTAPTYSARILGTPDVPVALRTDAGRITLNSGQWPHVEGRGILLSLPDSALLADLDPRQNRRLVIEAGGRSFDLGIREAAPNRSAGTVRLQLASDEALLADYAQLVDDNGPRAHETSLRGVCDYVLGKIGAHLEAGATDADITAFWEVTNLLANPSVEVNALSWRDVGGAGTLTRATMSSPVAPAGTYALRFTATRAGTSLVAPVTELTDFRVTPGKCYVFSYYIASQVSRQATALLQWRNANGTVVVSQTAGTAVTSVSAEFRRVTVIGRAPAGATHALPYVQTAGNAIGNLHYVDAAMFYEGNEVIPYHDGSVAPAGYTVAWQDVAHASASTRTPIIERRPESLLWLAGTNGLEFLHPLVQTAGFRLVCNEHREWTLRGADYREDGGQTYRYGVNIITAEESLDRSAEAWYDGAVFVYRWTDSDGIEQTRIDAWSLTPTPTKVIRREINAPYPGPGRAQYAVQRAQGKGRQVTGTKIARWTEAAEQTFSAVLEDTPIQVGVAERVEFDLARNEVTTTSRTTDTPASAWVLIPIGETWLDSPPGASWTGEVI